MNSVNTLKLVHQNVRLFSNTAGIRAKNHYDSLGIHPKATQADVKGAYYKLSMVYHPDKNKGSVDAAEKFRDITAAYEVLGNIRLRKLYDKGVSHIGVVDTPADDPMSKFYKSREQRSRPPSTGRTPIYNYDEWFRSHYGATFARNMMERKRNIEIHRNLEKEKRKEKQEIQNSRLIFAITTIFGTVMYLTVGFGNYDEDTYSVSKD